MKKIYLYGAGSYGRDVFNNINKNCDVRGYLDSNPTKWGTTFNGIPIIGGAELIPGLEYDEIIITSMTGMKDIREILLNVGVPAEKINTEYMTVLIESRLNFLRDFANLHQNDIKDYAVAEGGVFQGEFAKEINANFPNSTLYLFDTFEGFDAQDLFKDKSEGYSNAESDTHLLNTSQELVLSKLPHPEKAIIRKGYFPETAKGLEEQRFFFINLDFDLYQPTLEGLRFFYPKVLDKGVILVHDYFNPGFLGVAQAVQDFEKELGQDVIKLPIGDHCSIAIVKKN